MRIFGKFSKILNTSCLQAQANRANPDQTASERSDGCWGALAADYVQR